MSYQAAQPSSPSLVTPRGRMIRLSSDRRDVLCDPFRQLLWHGQSWRAWLNSMVQGKSTYLRKIRVCSRMCPCSRMMGHLPCCANGSALPKDNASLPLASEKIRSMPTAPSAPWHIDEAIILCIRLRNPTQSRVQLCDQDLISRARGEIPAGQAVAQIPTSSGIAALTADKGHRRRNCSPHSEKDGPRPQDLTRTISAEPEPQGENVPSRNDSAAGQQVQNCVDTTHTSNLTATH